MQKRFDLDAAACQVDPNGDLVIAPSLVLPIFFLLVGAGAAVLWGQKRGPEIVIAVFFLALAAAGLLRWANQAKVKVQALSDRIEWRRWFRARQLDFAEVAAVELVSEQREYAWSAHLVDRRKNEVDTKAWLGLKLKDGTRLALGRISGANAQERAKALAETLANTLGVPISTTVKT